MSASERNVRSGVKVREGSTRQAFSSGVALNSTAAIGAEVAQLDRFELLMTVIDPTAQLIVSKLTVYDITHQRTVLISPAATNASSRGDFLWWSTGDNETLTWHGIDLDKPLIRKLVDFKILV